MMPLTKSTAMQSENMKKAQPEISSLESKYKGKTDQDSMMKKSQETMQIYKKYGINPLSSCLFAILQIPLLFAFIEAINRTPALFEGSFLGLKLGMTPSVALTRGEWWYLLIVVIIAAVTYFSFTLNKSAAATPETQKQMNMMNKILIVFIVFMSFSLSTAIGIYWITSSSFTIFQNLLVHRSDKK
jgi:YidC/Oxa1 family membrane protein insertase